MLINAGVPHTIDIECDLWPEISYGGTADGYKGLTVTVVQDPQELDKIEKVLIVCCDCMLIGLHGYRICQSDHQIRRLPTND